MSRDWGVLGKRFTRQKLAFSVTILNKIKRSRAAASYRRASRLFREQLGTVVKRLEFEGVSGRVLEEPPRAKARILKTREGAHLKNARRRAS
jgi:hypothetical protein